MPKEKDHQKEGSDWSPKDWFISAVTYEGNVNQSFNTVIEDLDRKKNFIIAVQNKLCDENQEETDRLSQIGRKVKELENTLRFRLGLLNPEREGSWFRKAIHRDFGPFKSSMLVEPVFSQYRPEKQQELKVALKKCWRGGKASSLPFDEAGNCLWKMLLNYNYLLDDLAQLDGQFKDLRLDSLPDDLPAEMESRALRAFLINVRGEFASVKERLTICYDQLWSASEKFWHHQLEAFNEKEQKAKQRQKAYEQQKTEYTRQTSSQRTRTSKEKSQDPFDDKDMFRSFKDMDAMRFMGFRRNPPADILRKRYLEMAKKLHPDRDGGSEEAFKMLARSYKQLTRTVP